MSQVITATFEDGVLRPDEELRLPIRARVRLTVDLLEETGVESPQKDPEELRAAQKLARITPSHAELRALAAQFPPAPEWFEGDEERPF